MKFVLPLKRRHTHRIDRFAMPSQAVVVLGGGGARGIAHLGVLEALSHSKIGIHRIIGVSMGSLVGGLFATGSSMDAAKRRAITYLESPEFDLQYQLLLESAPQLKVGQRRTQQSDWYGWIQRLIMTSQQIRKLFTNKSFMGSDFLAHAVENLIPDIDIRDANVPITILAADLQSGLPVAIESGSLRQAIIASSSIPGFFPPVNWNDQMLLCDLGTVNSLPIEIAKAYSNELLIGVDVAGTIERTKNFSHAIDIMIRMDEIGERMSRRQSLHHCDFVIRPAVQRRAWFDFRNPHQLIQAGRLAANQFLRRTEWVAR